VPVRARRNLSSALHYWKAAATISYLRNASLGGRGRVTMAILLVQT
jgi:hypothetical protein